MYGILQHDIDLSTARVDSEHAPGLMTGLKVISLPDVNAKLRVKIGKTSIPPVILKLGMEIRLGKTTNERGEEVQEYFDRVFFTNEAGTGTAEIIFTNAVDVEVPLRVTADMIQSGVRSGAVTVTDVATAIPASALADRVNLFLQNDSAENTWCGGPTVTAAGATQGPCLHANGGIMSFTVAPGATVYLICDAGKTAVVNWMEGA